MTHLKSALFAALLGTSFAAPAAADINDEPNIQEGLIAAAMVVRLGKRCDSIGVRRLAGLNFLHSLRQGLRNKGYSSREIDAYIDDNEDRLEDVAFQRLRDLGAIDRDGPTHCAVARAQMAQGTLVGSFLR